MHPSNLSEFPSPERVVFSVDDDPNDRLLLSHLLERPGLDYTCRFFPGGGEVMDALIKVLRGAPAPLACFLDLNMGRMSGFDVLRWIRCQDALDAVPVIMMSSCEDPQKLHEAREMGAQCYVKKFPSAEELHHIIEEAQHYATDRSMPMAFHLPYNLLLNAVPHMAVA
ncbi:MAG TPA: response regulator [Opitutaceae bacterium]|nr:response regulator [Opitutaceae bacterium]